MTDRLRRLERWFLLRANRFLVAGTLTAAVFVAFVLVVSELPPPFVERMSSSDPVETLFGTMITVVVTGTTLVVTIGQLVLTQENGPLGDQQDRMRNSMDVRESMAELIGSPVSTDPAVFLGDIVETVADRAEELRTSVGGSDDGDFGNEIEAFTEDVVQNAGAVTERLDGARFGSFDVVSAALHFDYSRKLARIEHLSAEYEGSISENEHVLLDDLGALLSLYGPAREHVKTLYFQWALIALSQQILYAAVPAVVVAGVTLTVVDATTFPGVTLGIDHVVVAVGAAFAVTLLPFMLFVSYVLRILTVAKWTLAIEPLVLRDE
ncbi:hypothetical protein SAMN04488066_10880 [Halorubrum aquaticum]|uniref:Uncharacterized protein n=1 Tax=Halorubrum aquaticum TaxID=387340 RepID=A0A1I3AZF4_9EURY|nr:hypothetical protein [Halorubrum aquaticum]SFH55457.1 hypothetical protein SAMN04488066_10880 [Halorubrum aquaticum]